MNRRPPGLQLDKVVTGFLQYKSAEELAPVPVSGYERDLKLWLEYQALMANFGEWVRPKGDWVRISY